MFVQVISDKHAHHVATLLDTKGPEIRTAMLRGGKDIELQAGQAHNALGTAYM
jgi:pyruvate kinase